jgi:methylamine dehydrogenase light chain
MSSFLVSMREALDRRVELGMRTAAQTRGRRSFLSRLGTAIVGGAVLPMLPFDRSAGADAAPKSAHGDDTKCDYWAYCSLDGTRCNACGGSASQCPPGSQASSVSWVGTCVNPKDKKAYLVSYNDCCGKAGCMEDATCSNNQGERPGYRMGGFNDMNWCMANTGKGVHCSTSVIIGVAE